MAINESTNADNFYVQTELKNKSISIKQSLLIKFNKLPNTETK